MEMIKLNNGVQMPLSGFGVFQITDQSVCEESVTPCLADRYQEGKVSEYSGLRDPSVRAFGNRCSGE